jgi:hypothetical protein
LLFCQQADVPKKVQLEIRFKIEEIFFEKRNDKISAGAKVKPCYSQATQTKESQMAKGDKKPKEGKGKPKLTTKEKQDRKKEKQGKK